MVAMKSPLPTGKSGARVPQGPLLKGPFALTRSRGRELWQRGQGPQRCAKPPSLSLGTHVRLEGVGTTLPPAGPPGLLWGPAPGLRPPGSPACPSCSPSHPLPSPEAVLSGALCTQPLPCPSQDLPLGRRALSSPQAARFHLPDRSP